MNPSLAAVLCRIVPPEKLGDRLLVCNVLEREEHALLSDQPVLLYLFEVSKPWFPNSRLLPTLEETLTTGFSGLRGGEELGTDFEELLKKVNQALNSISETGETDWIGNLSGLILVLSGDQLHFSQTGRCPAYLLQRNRIRQITDDPTEERETHPLKTFSNLASGNLQPDDYLLLANQELYREISLDALRRVMQNTSPYQAAQTIVKELKRDRNQAVAAIFAKFRSGGEASGDEPQSIILEEEMQSALKKFQKKALPVLTKVKEVSTVAGKAGLSAAKQGGNFVQTTVAPKAGELVRKGIQKSQQLTQQLAARNTPAQPAVVVEIIEPKDRREALVATEVSSPVEEATHLPSEVPEQKLSENTLPPEASVHTAAPSSTLPATFINQVRTVWTTALTWLKVGKRLPYAAGLLALLILVISIASMYRRTQPESKSTTDDPNAKYLTDARQMVDKAATAVELKQEIEAAHELEAAQKDLDSLHDLTTTGKAEADQIWHDMVAQSDALTNTTRFTNSTSTLTFTGASRSLIANTPYFYGLADNSNQLLVARQGDGLGQTSNVSLADPNDHITALARGTETDIPGYVLTSSNRVYKVTQNDTKTTLTSVTPVSGSFATGDAIATYIGNIYILDTKSGLLWRYSNTAAGLSKGVSIVDVTKYNIQQSVSLAIDGSIYILKGDGTLQKFTSGQLQTDFSLKGLPTLSQKFIRPLQVLTDENLSSIYVLDAGASSSERSTARILEFDKSGGFIRQYGFPMDMTDIKSFDINTQSKKIWVVNGSQIREFNLP